MESNPENQNLRQQNYKLVTSLIKDKRSYNYISQFLIGEGLDEETAKLTIEEVVKQIKVGRRQRAKKEIIYGGLAFVGGIIITVVTYLASSGPSGGMVIMAWGPVIFGGITCLRGLINFF
jgi:hypothetical protein